MTDESDLPPLPEGFAFDVAPPAAVKSRIDDENRPCGTGRFDWVWQSGEFKGKPIHMFCAEPLCMNLPAAERHCTGPRFAPSFPQWNDPDPEALSTPRQPSALEVARAVDVAADLARRRTGVPDTRPAVERYRLAGIVMKNAAAAFKGRVGF